MAGEVKAKDDKTRKLYYSLLQAAKDGKDIEQAIEEMGKTGES